LYTFRIEWQTLIVFPGYGLKVKVIVSLDIIQQEDGTQKMCQVVFIVYMENILNISCNAVLYKTHIGIGILLDLRHTALSVFTFFPGFKHHCRNAHLVHQIVNVLGPVHTVRLALQV
jgi:hypothetical protein